MLLGSVVGPFGDSWAVHVDNTEMHKGKGITCTREIGKYLKCERREQRVQGVDNGDCAGGRNFGARGTKAALCGYNASIVFAYFGYGERQCSSHLHDVVILRRSVNVKPGRW